MFIDSWMFQGKTLQNVIAWLTLCPVFAGLVIKSYCKLWHTATFVLLGKLAPMDQNPKERVSHLQFFLFFHCHPEALWTVSLREGLLFIGLLVISRTQLAFSNSPRTCVSLKSFRVAGSMNPKNYRRPSPFCWLTLGYLGYLPELSILQRSAKEMAYGCDSCLWRANELLCSQAGRSVALS